MSSCFQLDHNDWDFLHAHNLVFLKQQLVFIPHSEQQTVVQSG